MAKHLNIHAFLGLSPLLPMNFTSKDVFYD